MLILIMKNVGVSRNHCRLSTTLEQESVDKIRAPQIEKCP